MTTRPRLLSRLAQLFRPSSSPSSSSSGRPSEPGSHGPTATVEIEPPHPGDLTITYTPEVDGDPDTGEIVWTWVPYDERDGRGKDRPVLVIARQDADCVLAVRLTSKSHDGDRDYLAIGAGPWDSKGRPSWVDVEQIYRVHRDGMRREASVLDLDRFTRVAAALQSRYGWRVGE
ncbi:type II toxin-antitoxin system PemK/MazF family toxin [Microbacterium insulae]|uniref:Type II toxin-antitoxin system PemK/MazF family toxin n=1 Tax=Microbacterium insulae TaxID=483014 RepID=A0ABW3AMC4_9MICO